MNILVTGSSGFIGTALVKSLIDQGYEVSCIIRPNSPSDTNNVNLLRIKDNSIESFKSVLKSKTFDFVINLASYGVKRGDTDLKNIIDGNITFLSNLISSLVNKPKMIINTGSCSEYGFIKKGMHIDESAPLLPINLYGAAKSATTLIGNSLAINHNIKFISLRLFGVYGEGEASYRLLPYVVKNLKKNLEIDLTSGEQQRDILYIDDVVNAFHSAIQNYKKIPSNASYNICSGIPVRVRDFIEYIAKQMNKSTGLLKWGSIERRDEPQWVVGNNALFKKYTNWKPKITMQEGIERAIGIIDFQDSH